MKQLEELQEKINYRFQQEALLRQALTHSSYANEKHMKKRSDNERLEFLGDAVLELVSSDWLYSRYTDVPEGELTKKRASIVCEPSLAFLSRKIDLGRYLFLGKGEDLTGGRRRPSVLSDAFEAVIGAIYLDGGFSAARQFVENYVMAHMEHMQLFTDSKTILQEIVQAGTMEQLTYELLSSSGPDHNKTYDVEVRIDGRAYGRGEAHSKKAAEQEAAYQAILKLRNRETQ